MVGQDIVYVILTGEDIDRQAKAIVDAMSTAGVQCLIFVASLGIYDEVPANSGNGTAARSVRIFRHFAELPMPSKHPDWTTRYSGRRG
jgi:hypothetical protein